MKHLVVATWPFSEPCVVTAMEALTKSHTAVQAVETAISDAEKDPSYGPYHVGCAGWHNAAGHLELDAAMMDGDKLDFGAVTSLSGFKCPISVARRVMEVSRHSFLTGEGAKSFAISQGFEYTEGLGTPCQQKVSLPAHTKSESTGHDTLGLLALNMDTQELCAGVTSSGMSGKAAGRVGDSALPGCGLYADSQVGAACCTGDGDQILKHCPSYKVVQLIKQGLSPQTACDQMVREIINRVHIPFELGIIAVDRNGNYGGSNLGIDQWTDPVVQHRGTFGGFPYVVYTDTMEKPLIITVPPVGNPS